MRSQTFFTLLALVFIATACAGRPSNLPSRGTPPPATLTSSVQSVSGQRLSAKEAVALAYAALPAEWKATARLAFVGRWSQFCNVGCSPFDVEEDPGIGSDGHQAHWVVIFAKDETSSTANVYYVEGGKARLVKSDIATIRPDELFALEGWVDSTEIQFRKLQSVGLELRTSDLFEDVDAELGRYSLLWLAETSFGHFDVYDATTGQYIKSR
ncbi:MAG: hypothetical protein H5T64_04660 [Chloroflexi bacterium]|nr:hypothetical protein [Chloroflexota bacterium]